MDVRPKSPRNPRRAYDENGDKIPPMTLAGMRSQGIRSLWATCTAPRCGHEAKINADGLPDDLPVPDVALKLRCSRCGGRRISTMPDWSESAWHRSHGQGR